MMTNTVGKFPADIGIHEVREISVEQAKKEILEYMNREKLAGRDWIPVSEYVEVLKLDIDRVDLILKEIQLDYHDAPRSNDYILKDSGIRKIFSTGANRDLSSGKGRFELLPPATLRALAIHFEKGCQKYGDRNWEKGIPVSRFTDSAIRHLLQFLDGCNDENHLIAALWNITCGYETILRTQKDVLPKELYDLPRKVTLPDPYEQKI